MTDNTTRIAAATALLDDEVARNSRAQWDAIFDNASLSPPKDSPEFQKQFYDLMIKEMEEGYQRNDKVRQEMRQRGGSARGKIPPQMRVSPALGRLLFAHFGWHTPNAVPHSSGIKREGLHDIAEAFGFQIDPLENQRQFMKDEDRKAAITKEKDGEYNRWLWGILISAFATATLTIFFYLRRKFGF